MAGLDFSDPNLLLNLGAGLIAGSKFGSNAGEGLLQGLQSYREGQASQAQQQAAQQEAQLRDFQIQQMQRQQAYQQQLGQQFAGKNPQASAVQAAAAAPQGAPPAAAGPSAPPPTAPMPQGAAPAPAAPPAGGPPSAPVPGAQPQAPQGQPQKPTRSSYAPVDSSFLASLPLPPTIKDQGDGTAVVQGPDGNFQRVPITQIRDQQKQYLRDSGAYSAPLNASAELATTQSPGATLQANPQLASAWVGYATAHGFNPNDTSSAQARAHLQQFGLDTHNNLASSLGMDPMKADGNWVTTGAGVQVNTKTGESKVTDSTAHDESINASLAGTPGGKVAAAASAMGFELPDGGRGFTGKVDIGRALMAQFPGQSPDQIAAMVKSGQISNAQLQQAARTSGSTLGQVALASNELAESGQNVLKAAQALKPGEFVPYNELRNKVLGANSSPELINYQAALRSYENSYNLLAARGGSSAGEREATGKMFDAANGLPAVKALVGQVDTERGIAERAARSTQSQLAGSVQPPGAPPPASPAPSSALSSAQAARLKALGY